MLSETPDKRSGGILRQILKTPVYKDLLRDNLNNMTPESGSRLVKTLMDEDPEVILNLVSSIPVSINGIVSALNELALRLNNNYPPQLMNSFLNSLMEDIDTDAVKECAGSWSTITSHYLSGNRYTGLQIGRHILSSASGPAAGILNTAAHTINSLIRNDPDILNSFVTEVFSKIDRKEIEQATHSLADAFLDHEWHLASWIWELVKKRVRKKLGR